MKMARQYLPSAYGMHSKSGIERRVISTDKGRWLMDPPSDRTVKAPRLLVAALRQIFPKVASEREAQQDP
jgi:hypothetical protein